MLKRTKYSRLRNDSVTSLEDRPVKRNLCLNSDFLQAPIWTPVQSSVQVPIQSSIQPLTQSLIQAPVQSSLWDFMANIRRVQRPQREWTGAWRPDSDPSLTSVMRPITLQRVASLPWTLGSAPSDPRDQQKRGTSHWDRDCSEKTRVKTAIHHNLKYMGSVEVTHSMRTLDFNTRMQVTREAINRVCERSTTKSSTRSKKTCHKGQCLVLGQSELQFSGSKVILSVSTESLTLICVSSLQKIAHHSMQSISFASGADPEMSEYIAYVAKDQDDHRACHILECPIGGAAEVINSIGQAFETRFQQMISQSSPLLHSGHRTQAKEPRLKPGLDYYNMVPGKTPSGDGAEELLKSEQNDMTVQRICSLPRGLLYENCSTSDSTAAPSGERSEEAKVLIQDENWFHGRLNREQAESLLCCSGDFLVRESSSTSGQYVLSGREGATVRHLLLVDPHGQVRTRDKVFLSISHLIQHHMESQMPILSGTSELCLKQPVLQTH